MKLELTLELEINIENEPFNINGIIKAVHVSLNNIGLSILREILEAIDQKASDKVLDKYPDRYRNKGFSKRLFKTPMGKLRVNFQKFTDTWEKKTIAPGKQLLEVPAYKQWLPWCLTPAAGLLAKISYSQSAKEASRLQGTAPSKSTIHRRLEDLIGDGAFTPYLRKRWFRYLMVDGTGARFQSRTESGNAHFYEGEIRFAFAAVNECRPFELVGMWVNRSWGECAKELYGRMSTDRLEALICDGGPGIVEAFMCPGMRVQRCQWHGKRDLSFILYQDGIKKREQQEILKAFDSIPTAGWTKAQVETIRPEDTKELNELRTKILTGLCDLYFLLLSKGYEKAAEYIGNLAQPYVTFINHLIDKNEMHVTPPKPTRQTPRRLKARPDAVGKLLRGDNLCKVI